jgi:hypothetical protein
MQNMYNKNNIKADYVYITEQNERTADDHHERDPSGVARPAQGVPKGKDVALRCLQQ